MTVVMAVRDMAKNIQSADHARGTTSAPPGATLAKEWDTSETVVPLPPQPMSMWQMYLQPTITHHWKKRELSVFALLGRNKRLQSTLLVDPHGDQFNSET